MPNYFEHVVQAISEVLTKADIPCILWGDCLLNIYGIPSMIQSFDFVVPDNLVTRAALVLQRFDKLEPCADLINCDTTSVDRARPVPAFHLHIKDFTITVELLAQSQTLWFLPAFNGDSLSLAQCLAVFATNFTVASDTQAFRDPLEADWFRASSVPVMVPKAHVFLEALIRSYARYVDTPVGVYIAKMLACMKAWVGGDGLLDIARLPAPLREFYAGLEEGEGGEEGLWQRTRELQVALGESVLELDDEDFWF